jgi:hypothetical protein
MSNVKLPMTALTLVLISCGGSDRLEHAEHASRRGSRVARTARRRSFIAGSMLSDASKRAPGVSGARHLLLTCATARGFAV